MQHIPRKRFGQNFLTDQGVIQDIVRAIGPQPGDAMVEIGPGLGALTDPLLEILPRLNVVEIDRDIIARLENNYPKSKLTIHAGDALKFDFAGLGERIRVVGNLPYNISTPILFHLTEYVDNIIDMHFMLQKEVVERMVGDPGSPEYGRLSVMLQYRYSMELQFIVPPDAFQPAPKVESAIVRMIPYAELPHPAKDEALFGAIVTAAFGQRRKTLRNTLKAYLDDAGFAALGIDPGLRAENLGVREFVAIANYRHQKM
ncbi:MAG: 16S rRNA (adenine(1518)-N(6)/adenine(1519)-N(6))-dimethyltransferase RsmA [Sulfuricella sp.]|nr:16S rRNA (adenine(1518)-N(6)/adenine(1519)-N(6))-dimethyltransferase RsmA [Sulfuricella sp.]